MQRPIVVTHPFSRDLTIANAAAAYTAGDQVGAVLTLPAIAGVRSGEQGPILIVQTLSAVDPDNQKAAFDVLLFRSSIADVGDNNAFAPTIADAQKYVGSIKVAAGDWTTYGSRAVVTKSATILAARVDAAQLFAVFVNQGAPTYTTASGLRVNLAGVIN